MAGEQLMSISKDERERAVQRSRRMYQTDLQSNLATAWDNGLKEGKRIGWDNGLTEGKRIGWDNGLKEGEKNRNIAIALKMAHLGEPIDRIMLITDLTRQEIEECLEDQG